MAALAPEGSAGIGHLGVGGEQGHQLLDIARLVGLPVALDQIPRDRLVRRLCAHEDTLGDIGWSTSWTTSIEGRRERARASTARPSSADGCHPPSDS